ncbi:MAG TPA: aminotransferase class III-fold pyridoxal phosphate-dependent enzyme [Nocardioides sp.]|jgi:4-aminobutyrate aminotransferase-like enzyme|uniref:aspartate aminotransferase family protein n=1 Tax=Nocardioides sp. TaxID=35761 RepID=UPI002E323A3C|nr:aminotransferase class III-fold pyridoxal phosphate-dependent enzyme [Nocardioides sp.]HEX3929220.1 aminotransferase class III-fold pyridoxal phosphate-dependent enzyme [Nocardioides sp.]
MTSADTTAAGRTPFELDGRPVPDLVTELPGPRTVAQRARESAVLYRGTGDHLAPLVMARKTGFVVEDLDGNLFLDMASASASVPLGAAHPRILEAALGAISRYGNEDAHAITSELVAPLAERLVDLGPEGCSRVDIALNGTEAVEIAIRLMRRATGRPLILAFMGSYHGESSMTVSLGAEVAELSRGVRAVVPGFVHVPYPNPYRSPFGEPRPGGTGDATVDYLRDHLLFHAIDPADVAGVVIEPVLGSGGVIEPPPTFFPALQDLCREHDWLLCADEVKTGCGRTGTFLAVERLGVRPDLVCLGKGLGGGVAPIGAVLGSERVLGAFDDVATGSTWAWLPGSCAAALAMLDELHRPGVLEHVRAIEERSREVFGALAEHHQALGDVRSVGALTALELVRDRTTRERDPERQEAVSAAMFRRGLLADSSTTSINVQPSLVTPLEVIDQAASIVDAALAEVERAEAEEGDAR